jgi:hypothetical protein
MSGKTRRCGRPKSFVMRPVAQKGGGATEAVMTSRVMLAGAFIVARGRTAPFSRQRNVQTASSSHRHSSL